MNSFQVKLNKIIKQSHSIFWWQLCSWFNYLLCIFFPTFLLLFKFISWFWKNFRLFDFSKIHASWKESTLFWLALLFSVWHFFQQKIKMSRETPLQNKNKKRILFPYFNLSSLVVFSMICRKYNTILKTEDLSCTLLDNSLSKRTYS